MYRFDVPEIQALPERGNSALPELLPARRTYYQIQALFDPSNGWVPFNPSRFTRDVGLPQGMSQKQINLDETGYPTVTDAAEVYTSYLQRYGTPNGLRLRIVRVIEIHEALSAEDIARCT